ncbi:MAG: nuclear transport factor 2 family protein [Pseudomonadota bacterium]
MIEALLLATSPVCIPGAESPEIYRIDATNAAVRQAFSEGDVDTIALYHHDDVIKSLGPGQYYEGKDALRQQLEATFAAVTLDFGEKGEDLRESLTVCGDLAVSITRFEITWTLLDGSASGVSEGRSMIVLVRSDEAPHGWVTLSEVIQPVG